MARLFLISVLFTLLSAFTIPMAPSNNCRKVEINDSLFKFGKAESISEISFENNCINIKLKGSYCGEVLKLAMSSRVEESYPVRINMKLVRSGKDVCKALHKDIRFDVSEIIKTHGKAEISFTGYQGTVSVE